MKHHLILTKECYQRVITIVPLAMPIPIKRNPSGIYKSNWKNGSFISDHIIYRYNN